MKLSQFLNKRFETAGIRGDDLAAVFGASALADLEIPDDKVLKFDEAYLTRDRAKNDSELVGEVRKAMRHEVFTNVDDRLKPFYKLLSPEKAAEIEKVFQTYEKIEKLAEALPEVIKTATGKVSEDVQKVESEWQAKYKAKDAEGKTAIETLTKQYKTKALDTSLRLHLKGYKFADAFNGATKETVENLIIATIKGRKDEQGNPFVIEQDDQGAVHVRKNVEGTLRDIYVKDNEKLTINKLLDEIAEPFIVKSNGGGEPNQSNGADGNKQRTAPTKSWDQMTSHERMWAQAPK